ncbi:MULTISPECIES: hypothetical protein [Pseudomonas syringae group]|uniref:hypothetical protein n=1 Tax=Pseudomonas syringae group TaxID=136849 RepID=UPI0011C34FC4|nr:hypothetical protein [Pseudomonas syringae group genomosp. 7]
MLLELLLAKGIGQWVQMNALRIPTLVRLLPKACRRKQKGPEGAAFLALLSRRQYLSRMDRFQHGRSARTLGPEGPDINKKCRVFAQGS